MSQAFEQLTVRCWSLGDCLKHPGGFPCRRAMSFGFLSLIQSGVAHFIPTCASWGVGVMCEVISVTGWQGALCASV